MPKNGTQVHFYCWCFYKFMTSWKDKASLIKRLTLSDLHKKKKKPANREGFPWLSVAPRQAKFTVPTTAGLCLNVTLNLVCFSMLCHYVQINTASNWPWCTQIDPLTQTSVPIHLDSHFNFRHLCSNKWQPRL